MRRGLRDGSPGRRRSRRWPPRPGRPRRCGARECRGRWCRWWPRGSSPVNSRPAGAPSFSDMGSSSWESDYWALRQEVGAAWVPRDVVRVVGPEAVSYLQGQLSQDVEALTAGRSAESLLLSPQGKIDALVRVTRTADDELLIDVDGGYGEAVVSRLRRFKLRTKVEIGVLAWRCLSLRGPRVADLALGAGLALSADWPGLPGADLVGEEPTLPDGARLCDTAAWDAVRVEAGVPRMGAELTERTIPAEAGVVDRTVSFTKGCYTGQELVARRARPRRVRARSRERPAPAAEHGAWRVHDHDPGLHLGRAAVGVRADDDPGRGGGAGARKPVGHRGRTERCDRGCDGRGPTPRRRRVGGDSRQRRARRAVVRPGRPRRPLPGTG